MPGNEVGDRVTNFFGQENLSQGQYNSQAVDGNWPGISNNYWSSSQRTASTPFVSNLKNFNVQQSDSGQGHSSSPHLLHGLNVAHSNLRQGSGRYLVQNQQTAANGYLQGCQVSQKRNEARILGLDKESDLRSMSRGMSELGSQGSGLGPYGKNLTRTDTAEHSVNFDFFGAQQQISGGHPGMLQSVPRQPSGINDMQLLQQRVMMTQMQGLHRQQQFPQLEAGHQNSITPASNSKQTVGNHSTSLINGMPVNEVSNLIWHSEVMANATNINWNQRGASPVMQGPPNGPLLSPEQRQALQEMGLIPNQGGQSLYALPISSSRGIPDLYSHSQVDKLAISQISLPHQFSHVQGDKPVLSDIPAGRNSFPAYQYSTFSDQTNTKGRPSVSGQDIEGKNVFGSTVQGVNGGLNMGNLKQVNSEQRDTPMQIFQGRQELAGLSETSQDKMAMQLPLPSQNVATLDLTEEKILFGSDENLCDAFGRNTGVLSMPDGADSFNLFSSLQSGSWSALMQSAVAEISSSDVGVQEEWSGLRFCSAECLSGNEQPSTTASCKKQSVCSLSHIHGNATNFLGLDINDEGINGNLQVCNVESGMNAITALPNSSTTWVNRQSNKQLPNNLDVCRYTDSSWGFKGNEGPGKFGHHAENPLVLESSINVKAERETHYMKNRSDQSAEGLDFNSAHCRPGGMRENVCFDVNDLQSPRSSDQANQRPPPVSRKFQYHLMGDLDVDVEPPHENKAVISSQQMSLASQVDLKSLVDNTSKCRLTGHIQKQLTSLDRSIGNYAPNNTASPRKTDTEASDGSILHLQQNQSSWSQGIGLQLAPPTQGLPRVPSVGAFLTAHVASETAIKGHAWATSTKMLPSQESSYGEVRNNILSTSGQIFDKALPNSVLAPGFPFSRILTQSKNMANIGGQVINTHYMENTHKTDKSADVPGFNSTHHRDGGVRENVAFNGSELSSPKLANQVSQRNPVSGKFQHHLMGDLGFNVEPSYDNEHVINSQAMPQQTYGGREGQDKSYLGQSKLCNAVGGYTVMEVMGNAPTLQGHSKSLVENASNSLLVGDNRKTSSSFDRSVGSYAPSKIASPSYGSCGQNTLEPLHKIREQGIAVNIGSSNHHLSFRVLNTESSDGSVVHHQQDQSCLSQGFGLQLDPPTRWLPVVSSHGSSEVALTTSHVESEAGDKGHTWLATTQSLPSHESSHMGHRNYVSGTLGQIFDKPPPCSLVGNIPQAFISGLPFSSIHTQNRNMLNHDRGVAISPGADVTYVDRTASMDQIDKYFERHQTSQSELASAQEMSHLSGTDQIRSGDSDMQILTSEAGTAPQPCVGEYQQAPSKDLHNVWTNVSSKQHPDGTKSFNHLKIQPINDCEMAARPQKPGDKDLEKDENDLFHIGPCSVYSNGSVGKEQLNDSSGQKIFPQTADVADETASALPGKESVMKCSPDGSYSSPAATSSDIEAFGLSLRPSNFLQQSFSLQHQVQPMRRMEVDPNNRDAKRFKVSDYLGDKQEVDANDGQHLSYGYNAIVKNVSSNHSSMPLSDPHMLNFLSKNGGETNTSSPEGLGYGQKNSLQVTDGEKAATSAMSEHYVISPQMAPSWFEQYGTFKNGKILSIYGVQNMAPLKIMDQSFVTHKQSESLQVCNSVEQVNNTSNSSLLANSNRSLVLGSVKMEHKPSQLLPRADEGDLVQRPKKYKSATSELVPWHKELAEGSERFRNISMAELDWAQAGNRLIEKIEEDAEILEDLPLTLKSKRRLVLTSQLMQQLLNPPPAAILSEDVKLHHEIVVYSLARFALGNSCSSVLWSGSDALVPPVRRNVMPEKLKSSEKIDQYVLKVVEDVVVRAKKLENDILRLNNRASILDLRVECEDLERFSVINRFAKFYGRGQNDGVDASSSSDAAASAKKMCLQKYVTAVSMPRNIPDRVQCLSL